MRSWRRRAERSFAVVSTNAIAFPMTDLYSSAGVCTPLTAPLISSLVSLDLSAAAGVGFASVQCTMLYGPVISYALGPGTLFADQCTQFSTVVLAAWTSFLFGLLHIFWVSPMQCSASSPVADVFVCGPADGDRFRCLS